MAAIIDMLKDSTGKQVHPVTEAKAVYLDNGETVEAKIADMESNFLDGCNVIASAITAGRDGQGADGVETPAGSSPQTMAENIREMAEMCYASGAMAGASAVSMKIKDFAPGQRIASKIPDWQERGITAANFAIVSAEVRLSGSSKAQGWTSDLSVSGTADVRIRISGGYVQVDASTSDNDGWWSPPDDGDNRGHVMNATASLEGITLRCYYV